MAPVAVSVASQASGMRRPVPWRRMAWVTWRQHRAALAGAVSLLGAIALYLWLTGTEIHHAYAAVTACHPAGSAACTASINYFVNHHDHTATFTPSLMQAVPALIGAFLGAPVLARELETGTFRYAWSQGFGRWRWTAAKLVPLVVALAAATAVFGILFSWYDHPFIADGQSNRMAATVFDLGPVTFAAWTAVAFSIGSLSGVLVRRVLPAITASLVAYTALAVAAVFLRQHYLSPLTTSRLTVPASALITRNWGTKDGRVAFTGPPPGNLLAQFCPPSAVGPGKPSFAAFGQCLSHHGYTLWTSYQPANRFWNLQLIEGIWLLALSILLLAATIWTVHRRAT